MHAPTIVSHAKAKNKRDEGIVCTCIVAAGVWEKKQILGQNDAEQKKNKAISYNQFVLTLKYHSILVNKNKYYKNCHI